MAPAVHSMGTMATYLITFRGGHEMWDGTITTVVRPEHPGTGYAERWVKDEGLLLGYSETDELVPVQITEGGPGRERTRTKQAVVYEHVFTREEQPHPRRR